MFIVAADPKARGKGYASQLLREQITIHRVQFPGTPVVLDTTTDQAQRVYEKMGFRELGRRRMQTGADWRGIKLGKGQEDDGQYEQRVLILEGELS